MGPLLQHVKAADLECALDSAGGDRELLVELCGSSLDEFPRLLTEIRRAVDECDALALRRSSCALKDTLMFFGAMAARRLAQQMEDFATEHHFAGADELYLTLEAAVNPVIAVIREELPRMRGPGTESPQA
jgi:hypothetical protein